MMKPSSVKKVSTNSNVPKPSSSLTSKKQIENKAQLKPTATLKEQVKLVAKIPQTNSLNKQLTTASSVKKVSSSITKSVDNQIEQKKQQKPNIVSSKNVLSRALTKNIQKSKKQQNKNFSWGYLPYDLFLLVCHFHSHNIYEVYFLSKVCRGFRFHLNCDQGKYCWIHLKDCQKIDSFKGIKGQLEQNLIKARQKMAVQYEKNFIKLFNYGSTKQNIANKLIDRLNLEVTVQINKKRRLQKIPFKLKTYNFSSYMCFKVTDIQDFKYDFYTPHNMFKDKLNVSVKFFSRKFKVHHELNYELLPEDIVECSIKQKAFNYHLDKNLILTFFEGDDHFLYFFFQMSALQLVNIFRTTISESQKQIIQGALKKMPLHKKLAVTQFEDFIQYMKYQADFELHMSYHNSVKQIFTFCDTKVYPVKYDNKQALFMVKVEDTFPKVETYKLDNKMGISEGIQNLYLLDLTLKDRDKFLITFSGFLYARKAQLKQRQSVQNYFNFSQNEMKILYFKSKKFEFKILIIQEKNKNFIKNIELTFLA